MLRKIKQDKIWQTTDHAGVVDSRTKKAVRDSKTVRVCLLERLTNDRELPVIFRDAVTGQHRQNNVTNRPLPAYQLRAEIMW